MLKALEPAEFRLTTTTEKLEAAAESSARMMPIMSFHFQING
jgi:hypothetical protein